MTKEEFAEGLMFYRACCGKEPELAHVEVWYEMLNYMPIDQFVGAIKIFISNEENPARMNFVATVKKYGGVHLKMVRHEKYLAREKALKEQEEQYRQKVLEEHKGGEIKKLIGNIGQEVVKPGGIK